MSDALPSGLYDTPSLGHSTSLVVLVLFALAVLAVLVLLTGWTAWRVASPPRGGWWSTAYCCNSGSRFGYSRGHPIICDGATGHPCSF